VRSKYVSALFPERGGEAREGLELAGPMSFAEAFYLARRAEDMGDMEARFATRTRARSLPRGKARVTQGE